MNYFIRCILKAVFHSVKIFARAEFLVLKIPRGKISISISHVVKKKKKGKDIKITLWQQYYKSRFIYIMEGQIIARKRLISALLLQYIFILNIFIYIFIFIHIFYIYLF